MIALHSTKTFKAEKLNAEAKIMFDKSYPSKLYLCFKLTLSFMRNCLRLNVCACVEVRVQLSGIMLPSDAMSADGMHCIVLGMFGKKIFEICFYLFKRQIAIAYVKASCASCTSSCCRIVLPVLQNKK